VLSKALHAVVNVLHMLCVILYCRASTGHGHGERRKPTAASTAPTNRSTISISHYLTLVMTVSVKTLPLKLIGSES